MKRLLTWALVAVGAILVLTLCFGCAAQGPTSPSSDVEQALLDETAHMAAVMGVQGGRGEITTKASRDQIEHEVVGWYLAGVAYYYRPNVERFVSLVPGECPEAPRCEIPHNVAVHELAHAVSCNHDARHWCESARYATPTYPWPGPGMPTCKGVR